MSVNSVWLDVEKKVLVFTTDQNVTKHLGYFCYKICYLEIPKIAQSGHTGLSIAPIFLVDTWLTEFWIDRIRMVLQKGYVLYV